MFALSSSSKRIWSAGLWAALLISIPFAANAQDADDPPPEAGRISFVSGNVSIQPVTSDEWGQAYPNLPLGPGDRIFTDANGRAEIQIGQTYVRIGPSSDVTMVDDSQFNINFGVAQGSIRLHSFSLWPRQLVDISTPNGNAEFGQQGDLRVDVLPSDGATVFTNLGQFADITAAGNYRQQLDYGQSLEVAGSNPVYPQWLQPAGPDELDSWSQERDQRLARVASFNYVSPDVPGAADLDAYGDWQPQTEYGAVWFPRDVPADWQPYHNGHWINRDPWGWVWVEDEPWGYAPFHYGRWVVYGGRWGWIPGPVNVRPVWSPALVVFAGGGNYGGGGLSVWFPLGPGEPYRPWYRCSPHYIDQVNITNIREAPRVRVERSYVNIVNVTNITYVNKTYVTAVRRDDFASGRRVRDVAVRVDPREAQQFRPLPQPQVAPPTHPIITRPVAHPVPVSVQRPMLINQQGKEIVAKPGAAPIAPPVRPTPPIKPIPGRTVVAAPEHPGPSHPGQPSNQFPVQGSRQQQPVNDRNDSTPVGTPRANPVTAVPGNQRGILQQTPNPPANGNQQPGVSNEHRTQPGQPAYQTPRPPNYQEQNRPTQFNQQPPNQPNNQPTHAPNYQEQNHPNQVNPQEPGRPNYQAPRPPNYQEQNRPTQFNQQPPNQPNNQPPHAPNYQEQNHPNQVNPQEPGRPNYQAPRPPNYQQQNRPTQFNQQPPNQPNNQPPHAPNYQEQNHPQSPAPVQNHQEPVPVQPDRYHGGPPQPSPDHQPANHQMDQPRPAPPPQMRPAPPPQPDRSAEQQRNGHGPPQQSKPQNQVQKQNNNGNKDQNKNDNKDEKKHEHN